MKILADFLPYIPITVTVLFWIIIAYLIISTFCSKRVNDSNIFNYTFLLLMMTATGFRISGMYFSDMSTWPIFGYLYFLWRAIDVTDNNWQYNHNKK